MAYTNSNNPDCPNCNKSGLAILPVRYAVVPLDIDATLPAPLGNKVSDVVLKHHKYALRTLREGYFYIFHEKHARGSHITWEIYSVAESGTLWKLASPNAIKSLGEPTCSISGHNIPASVITIESPEKCKRVWIAFSEHAWSADTIKAFSQDAKLRDRRMQTFLPAMWISAGGYRHGIAATKSNIEKVLEYKSDFNSETINGKGVVPKISSSDGSFNVKNLAVQTTRYKAFSRVDQSEALEKIMHQIGQNKEKAYSPMIMAIWDAVGITHELNGFRNDTAGWVEKYTLEREQQIAAMLSIEGLKRALSNNAAESVDQRQKSVIEQDAEYPNTSKRRLNAAKLSSDRRANEVEVCDILDDWKTRKVPASAFSLRLTLANEKNEPERSREIAKIKADANSFLIKRSESAAHNIERAHEGAWQKYEELLAVAPNSSKKLYQIFKENHDKFHLSVDKLMTDRTTDLVEWLNSRFLIDALIEFHKENINDGLVFDDIVGSAIFGINSSESGRAQLDFWVNEIKATENNLIWRSISLNQSACIRELDSFLEEARKHANENTPANVDTLLVYTQKSLKALVDTYKRAATINTSNTDASSTAGSKAFNIKITPINSRNVDRVVMTAGDKLFKIFGLADILDRQSEYMMQHLMSIRFFVAPVDSLNLIRSQIKNAPNVRRDTMDRLRALAKPVAGVKIPKTTPHTEAMEKGWKNFKETNAKAPSAMKDARIALLVMLVEGVNFSKLLYECVQKNDAKSWWLLVASSMTITSALFDVASIPLKSALLKKGDAISFQRVKLLGGVLSASAAAVTVVWDVVEAKKEFDRNDVGLARLYQIKIAFGVANVGIIAATTFTYAAPLIEKLTGSAAAGAGARALGARATAMIASRILFMAAGAWITVFTFGIQILIWIFSKDELQNWCRFSPFGIASNTKYAYKSTSEQVAAMEKVLVNMGLIEDNVPKDYPKIYPTLEEMRNHD